MKEPYAAAFILLLLIISNCTMALANSSVGIKAGDSMEYEVEYTGTPPQFSSSSFKFEIQKVEGTTVTAKGTTAFLNGTTEIETYIVDISKNSFKDFDGFIVPPEISENGQFYSGDTSIGNLTVAKVENQDFAGENRKVIYASFDRPTGPTSFGWDQKTGVLLELVVTTQDYTLTLTAASTNMWGPESLGMNIEIIIAAIALSVLISLIVGFAAIKKTKRTKSKSVQ